MQWHKLSRDIQSQKLGLLTEATIHLRRIRPNRHLWTKTTGVAYGYRALHLGRAQGSQNEDTFPMRHLNNEFRRQAIVGGRLLKILQVKRIQLSILSISIADDY